MDSRVSRTTLAFAGLCTLVLCLVLAAGNARAGTESAPTPLNALMKWRSVGPYIGGRVVAVAGVPGERDLFYMGGVDGGVWRSTDYGVKWVNLTDGTLPGSSNSIGAIAVAPSDPKVIYVGTGESDIRGDMITGDGVFRSDDAGKSWHAAGLADTHTISGIVVDPKNPDVVYASSMGHVFKPNGERGVFKSVDGGKTWSKILYVDAKTGAIDLVMDPNNPDVLYAAMWQAYRRPWTLQDGGPGSGLYKSSDGGAHWSEISRHSGFPQSVLGRVGVSVAASDPRVVYAIVQAKDGGVFRSNDAGATWARVNSNWSLRQRAFYYMSIFVDPTDANTVYVPEVDALWVSHDGGKTFAKLHTPHGDNHIIWINPHDPKLLLEGNDGGATVSTDGGLTWSGDHNQPTGQFYHVALDDQFPFHIYGAQQDEGSFEGPSAASAGMIPLGAWHSVAYGEATFVAPQPGNPNITYGSGYFSIQLRYDMATGQFREVSPWPEYQEGAASNQLKYRFGWTHPILFSAAKPGELLLASQYVLKSTDGGEMWTRISPDLTRNDPATERPSGGPVDLDQSGAEIFPDISALAPSPLDGNVIWAGSADGLVHVTADGGKSWKLVTPKGLPGWAQISSIEPSHVAKGSAYLTASRYMWDDFHPYVFETTDYGAHWTPITTGLPADQYAFVVRQDPNDARLLFLGTKNSVYASYDGGLFWHPLALNLPKVQVRDLAVNVRQGDLVAATHGRSFWILDNLALLEQMTRQPTVAADAAQVFAPETAWLTHAYGASPYAKFVTDAGANPPFGATVFFHIPADYDGKAPVTLSFVDAQGQVVRRFDLHLKATAPKPAATVSDNWTPIQAKEAADAKLTAIAPGMNRLQWNLRWPDATEVTGFQAPIAAGGLDDTVEGPVVVPGRYTAVLDFGGKKSEQAFTVALDPRLHPAPGALAARLALGLKIHVALDTLDRTLNQAIALRDQLDGAVAAGTLAKARAQPALNALDADIADLVALQIQSSEGSLLHETKLRSHLAYLAADIDLSYDRPTQAEYAVFDHLDRQAQAGERKLHADIAQGQRVL
ncbi:WD40/YVTN/BNR-like repeat-containing protein [Metallibacterium scheffleri]|nr:glycosyl hydrolase [Metallibacterium scheffleri]